MGFSFEDWAEAYNSTPEVTTLLQHINTDDSALEVGIGSGRLTKRLSPYFNTYIGIDIIEYNSSVHSTQTILLNPLEKTFHLKITHFQLLSMDGHYQHKIFHKHYESINVFQKSLFIFSQNHGMRPIESIVTM